MLLEPPHIIKSHYLIILNDAEFIFETNYYKCDFLFVDLSSIIALWIKRNFLMKNPQKGE